MIGLSLSRDGRTLAVENEVLDSDIWLREPDRPSRVSRLQAEQP